MNRAVWVGRVRYYPGSGCIVFDDDSVVTLTVGEEQLFELLCKPPFVAVPMGRLSEELAITADSVRRHVVHMRLKLGANAILTSKGRGYRLNPAGIVKDGAAGSHVVRDVIPWKRSG